MSEIIEIKIPDIGDFAEVEVIEVSVQPGDQIEAEQTLAVLESDKASMDIPSTAAGVVKEVKIAMGDMVAEGTVVVTLEVGAASAPTEAEVPAVATAAVEAATSSAVFEAVVPDIGDFAEVEVIEVLVRAGEQVEAEQTLVVLESDKASMDVPTTVAGTIQEVKVAVGDKISEGDLIALLSTSAEAAPVAVEDAAAKAAPAPAPKATPQAAAPKAVEPAPALTLTGSVHATPSIRRFARELGVDLTKVGKGGGRKGRILKEDVKAFVKKMLVSAGDSKVQGGAGIPPIPAVNFSKFGDIEEKKLSKIKRLTGVNLSRAWLNLPMVTHHDEADITEMEAFRKSVKADAEKAGVKVTGLVFIMKAMVAALKQYPQFNASLSPDGERLIYKKYFNIGIAVDTPNGLVVPVFKDVDKKSLYELSAEMVVMSAKARDGKLMPADMQGGCMTISSLGGIGGTAFTPIVNAPEVAILGVTRSSIKPIWNGSEFEPRMMVPLDLTYDHRVIDGADAARFCVALTQYLGDVRRLLL
jgi:pyruvate dehydrogenase E2 component (dihydrolipoamide acetyltransferase)